MKRFLRPAAAVMMAAWLPAACQTVRDEQPETAPSDWNVLGEAALASSHGRIDFAAHVKPVLEAKCAPCHQRSVLPFFSLENRGLAFAGGRIVPGNPEASRLLMHVHGTTPGMKAMPPVGNRLTPDEQRILRAWIAQGARWPTGQAGTLDLKVVQP